MKSHHSNYFSRAVLLFFSLLLLCHTSKGQSNDTTKVGVFITSIYDLDYSNNSFSVDFWIWRINTNREFKDYYSFSASNAKESKKISSSTDFPDQNENILPTLKGDTTFWDYENFSTVVKHEFNITKYPFDEEILVIEFEGENYYDDWVKLQIDEKESGYADLKINGWEIGKMRIEKFNTTYPTNFGSPGDKGSHTYSGFKILIPIKREGTALFFKLFQDLFSQC